MPLSPAHQDPSPEGMRLLEVLPVPGAVIDLESEEGRRTLRERYRREEDSFVRLNMITSVTGAAAGSDGTSDTLTNRVDRTILKAVRDEADVVVVGAQSVRAEGYVVPRTATLAIVTASGRLSGHRLVLDDEHAQERVVVLCPESRAAVVSQDLAPQGIRVVGVPGDDVLAPRAILDALAERGARRVVCEGGPLLASRFAAADVIDEYCLTVSPLLEPTEHPFLRIEADHRPDTAVAGMLVDAEGFSYLRLRRR